MKLSQAISELQSMFACNGDIEITYNIFTVDDIKEFEHFDDDSIPSRPYNDDKLAVEIVQECEKYMWDAVSDDLWNYIEHYSQEVVKRNKKDAEEYQQYLRLKAKFE